MDDPSSFSGSTVGGGNDLRDRLLSSWSQKPAPAIGDGVSDEQLADRVEELRSLIYDLSDYASHQPSAVVFSADVPQSVRSSGDSAQALLNMVISDLVERIEGARIEGFQDGLHSQYRAVQDWIGRLYGFVG